MTLPSFGPPTNWIEVPGANDRRDVENFLGRVRKMDESAAVRIVDTGGALRFWARTPFGPLGTRVVGQLDAVQAVSDAVRRARAGERQLRRMAVRAQAHLRQRRGGQQRLQQRHRNRAEQEADHARPRHERDR